jgi:nicotinic acid phosphoribosyltransferase
VIKLVECNGKPVAKLSDSPGKTICHDKALSAHCAKPSTFRRLKRPVNHHINHRKEPFWLLVLYLFPKTPLMVRNLLV